MDALLNQLSTPLAIGLVVLGVIILVGVIFFARRLRQPPQPDEGAPPPTSGPIDYTSLPIEEEPQNWRERFAQLSLPGRILLIVVPLLVLIVGALLITLLLNQQQTASLPPTPTPEPLEFSIETATVANPQTIRVVVRTNLPRDSQVQAQLLSDGAPFNWSTEESNTAQVRAGQVELSLRRADNAPDPSRDAELTVQVQGSGGPLGEEVSDQAPVDVPELFAAEFYNEVVAEEPTRAPSPTLPPSPTPEPTEPTPEASPTPEPEPEPEGFPAIVFNGGNVRSEPFIDDNIVGGVNAGEEVTLLERTPDGGWYRLRTIRGEEGWVSASLLTIDPDVAQQVPVEPIARVFNGGNVRREPEIADNVVGGVNAGETVVLLEKTADGSWYRLRTVRGEEGWASATLLTIDPAVAEQVPVQGSGGSRPTSVPPAAGEPTPTTEPVELPPGDEPTAPVVNSGSVRSRPELDPNNVLDEVNAGEEVALLARTSDRQWFRIRNERDIEGWVNIALIQLDPAVIERLPVE
jgi:flagellar FliL protein